MDTVLGSLSLEGVEWRTSTSVVHGGLQAPEGGLYLAVVMDLFSRKIVDWAMRDPHAGPTRLLRADDGDPPAAAKAWLIHHLRFGRRLIAFVWLKFDQTGP